MDGLGLLVGHLIGDYILQSDWQAQGKTLRSLPCLAHCLLYTLAVWACSFWWMPWWGLAVVFAGHYPLDRYRLAGWWMRRVAGQAGFATTLAPWSVIVVDNTFHLIVLFLVGTVAKG